MIAWPTEPRAAITIVESAVAMNSALPSPQPARKPTMAPIESESPASAEKTMIRARPDEQRALGADPAGDHAGDSIATPITAM